MKYLLLWAIQAYRALISPLFPPMCRFHPTCSRYALQAIERFGGVRGSWLALRRITRCHPFHPGGYDPVPDRWGIVGQASLSDIVRAERGGDRPLASLEAPKDLK